MNIGWQRLAPFVLSLAAAAGFAVDPSWAMAGGPCNSCKTSCGCGDSSPLGKYGDGNEPLTNPGEDLAGNPIDLGEGAPAQAGDTFAALDAAGAYIDSAIVATRFRLRFDAAYDNPLPDRAEFFYAQCGNPGPPDLETRVDYQDITPYLEWAYNDSFSLFVEAPVRFLNPEVNNNTAGFSDLNAGFKYALIACPDEFLTAQLRVYTPTGDADRGLGTAHASIEPAFLYFRRLTERLILQAEVRDWIPVDGSRSGERNFSGNVLRYGVGFGYDVWQSCDVCSDARLTAVGEFVGWTILDGLATNGFTGEQIDQQGVTIANAKIGLRYTEGAHSFYGGFGTALTENVWYQDIMRFEYIRAF